MHISSFNEAAGLHGLPLRHRRPAPVRQSDIARALRAAKQVGEDYGIRVEPDGAIIIGKLMGQGTPGASRAAPVRDFVL
jgi:hypothetical protein